MYKKIYNIIIIPIKLYEYLWNWFYLNLTNTEYQSFPLISGRIVRRGSGKLLLGNNVKITSSIVSNPVGLNNQSLIYVSPGAIVSIGNNVGISNSLIFSKKKITIEDNVLIGGSCQFLDSDFHSLDYNNRILSNDSSSEESKSITIREGAFIGANSIILKGVEIGSKSIIGAGSIVTRNIPNSEIWAGNPAKFIKKLN